MFGALDGLEETVWGGGCRMSLHWDCSAVSLLTKLGLRLLTAELKYIPRHLTSGGHAVSGSVGVGWDGLAEVLSVRFLQRGTSLPFHTVLWGKES